MHCAQSGSKKIKINEAYKGAYIFNECEELFKSD